MSDLKEIKELMGQILDEEGMQALGDVVVLKGAWKDIVGERMAEKTQPYKLGNGTLYVGVQSHGWAQELHYQAENIKQQASALLGLKIERLVIKKINVK